MKKVMLTAGLIAVLSLTVLLTAANAANTATATATAKANIIRGITIARTQDLNFGQIVPNKGGVITVSTKGIRTSSDRTMLIPESYDTPLAAAFNVTGDGAHGFQIILPTSAEISNGEEKMLVNNLVSSLDKQSILSGKLNEVGTQSFTVGAELTVKGDQAPGAYAGTFDVTVTYQ